MDVSSEQLVEQAKERFALQDYFGCIHLLEDVIRSGRAFADAFHLLGLSYHLVEQPERALEALDRAVGLNPRYVEAHIHRGLVLSSLGRSAEADGAFTAARANRGQDRAGITPFHAAKLANQHAALGEAYAEAGAMSQAVEQYHTALVLGPAFHDLRYRLARLLLESGRSLEAREELERVVKARPGFVDARAALGLACYVAGDAGTARAVWRALQQDHPSDHRAAAYLGLLDRATDRT